MRRLLGLGPQRVPLLMGAALAIIGLLVIPASSRRWFLMSVARKDRTSGPPDLSG